MPKCSFCGRNYDIPRGMTFVLPNGEILHFCSSKCRKNNKLGRKGEKNRRINQQNVLLRRTSRLSQQRM